MQVKMVFEDMTVVRQSVGRLVRGTNKPWEGINV